MEGLRPFLEGVLKISALLTQAELPEEDPDWQAFKLVESETDHLPIGDARNYWSKDALRRLEPDIERATKWARETTFDECKSLINRFRKN